MPRVSVIMPVHRAGAMLRQSLDALLASDLPREQWELIVVDDASTDGSVEIAKDYADTVLQLEPPARGPAHARNRGTRIAEDDYLIFLDVDVCVHPDVIRRFSDVLAGDPTVAAVFGEYDATPPEQGLVSQYRNLVHHYVHAHNAGDAETSGRVAEPSGVRSSSKPECSTTSDTGDLRLKTSNWVTACAMLGIG